MAGFTQTELTKEQRKMLQNARSGGNLATGNQPLQRTVGGMKGGYDTSYYDNQINQYNAYADQLAQKQIGEANKARQSALKQAYIQNLQNQRTLNNNMALAGIRGGATETSNLNLANIYGTARNAANTDYTNAVNQINQTTAENKFNNMMNTESARRQYIENRQAEDRANAREDKQIAYQRQVEEEERQRARDTEKYTAKYSRYYDIKKLKELRKKAKSDLERQIIDARIGYIKEQNRNKNK